MQKLLIAFSLIFISLPSFAQNKNEKLKVFIDSPYYQDDFIRQQLNSVDYVNDKFEANLHLLITEQHTGSGGEEIKLNFIPKSLDGLEPMTLTTYTSPDATTDMKRMKILEAMRFGLAPYLFATGQEQLLQIVMEQREDESKQRENEIISIDDPFNFWVFSVEASGDIQAEDTEYDSEAEFQISAERTTELWRLETEAQYSIEYKGAKDDGVEISRENINKFVRSEAVYSLSPHWSAGFTGILMSDSYRNLESYLSLGPAIEYNFFPWKISDRKKFIISYHLNAIRFSYFEETIYNKMDEVRARQSIRTEIEYTQPWGDFEIGLEGRNYLHDFNRYNISFDADLGIRLFKGLSIFVETRAQAIHDQLYLPKAGSSIEDILIQRRKQATAFEIEARLGFRYSFGSIYNNVVNQRL